MKWHAQNLRGFGEIIENLPWKYGNTEFYEIISNIDVKIVFCNYLQVRYKLQFFSH